MRFLAMAVALIAIAGLPAGQAAADCACLCVDGARKTVCTAAEEADVNGGLCAAARQACPEVPEAQEPAGTYEPPTEGAVNCRDAQVYDSESGGYVTAKVCDTASDV